MIEVFRTNVNSLSDSTEIVLAISNANAHHVANFDLQDSDRILRVVSPLNDVDISAIADIVRRHGYSANVLVDEMAPYSNDMTADPG